MTFDLVFIGLAQNCERYAPQFLKLNERLKREEGLRTYSIIGENGSRDRTREIFSQPGIYVLNTEFMGTIPTRLERMARGREFLRRHALQIESRAYCVIDLDNTLERIPDPAVIKRVIDELDRGDVFAISAQSLPFFYDLLAFESNEISFQHLDLKILDFKRTKNPLIYYGLFRDFVYRNQKLLSTDRIINCISSFNGMCIYSAESFRLGSYVDFADFTVCEHVNFNRQIHRSSRKLMRVDPSLTVSMPSEHGPNTALQFFSSRAAKSIRSLLLNIL